MKWYDGIIQKATSLALVAETGLCAGLREGPWNVQKCWNQMPTFMCIRYSGGEGL